MAVRTGARSSSISFRAEIDAVRHNKQNIPKSVRRFRASHPSFLPEPKNELKRKFFNF